VHPVAAVEEGSSVDLHVVVVQADDVGDRRGDITQLDGVVHDLGFLLLGPLHEQWDVRQLSHRRPGCYPLGRAGLERDPVVRGNDEKRVVVDAGVLHPIEHRADQRVGELGLQQVALHRLHGQPPVPCPPFAAARHVFLPRKEVREWVALARRKVGPRLVRHHEVPEQQAGAVGRAQEGREREELRTSLSGSECRPPLSQRIVLRCGRDRLAETSGAEAGERLGRVELVSAREEREHVVRDERCGLQPLVRVHPGQDRGHHFVREGCSRRCVPEPRRIPLEPSEVREQLLVDHPVAIEQRSQWQFVEHDHDDRRCPDLVDRADARAGAATQEQDGGDDGGPPEGGSDDAHIEVTIQGAATLPGHFD
jgi:hypothetical protein